MITLLVLLLPCNSKNQFDSSRSRPRNSEKKKFWNTNCCCALSLWTTMRMRFNSEKFLFHFMSHDCCLLHAIMPTMGCAPTAIPLHELYVGLRAQIALQCSVCSWCVLYLLVVVCARAKAEKPCVCVWRSRCNTAKPLIVLRCVRTKMAN